MGAAEKERGLDGREGGRLDGRQESDWTNATIMERATGECDYTGEGCKTGKGD